MPQKIVSPIINISPFIKPLETAEIPVLWQFLMANFLPIASPTCYNGHYIKGGSKQQPAMLPSPRQSENLLLNAQKELEVLLKVRISFQLLFNYDRLFKHPSNSPSRG